MCNGTFRVEISAICRWGGDERGAHDESFCLARRSCRAFQCLVSVLVIRHHTNLAWLILHVVPAQTVAVEYIALCLLLFGVLRVASQFFLRHILAYAPLALAVHEEFCLRKVGIYIYGSHLALASRPRPVGQHVQGVLSGVPLRAVEIVSVLGQSGKVADAEITRTAGPVLVVGRRFAQIVEARPHKLPYGICAVVHHKEVVVGQIAPRTVFRVVT